jgi:hypothetical protein
MNGLDASAYAAPAPPDADIAWIDYRTGLATDADCLDAVALPVPVEALPPRARSCGNTNTQIGSGIRNWLRRNRN